MYGEHPNGSPEMGKVITDWHCDRLRKLIEGQVRRVIVVGRVDRDIKFVELQCIVNPLSTSPVMEEEMFTVPVLW
jgi:acyl-CoA reductase-like NAD-dependent aldehyde dehydrogenase